MGRRIRQWREALLALLLKWGLRLPQAVHYIGGSDTLPPPLPREEEALLLERLAKIGRAHV